MESRSPGAAPLRYALPNLLLALTIAGLLVGGYWIWLALLVTAVLSGPVDEAIGDDRKDLSAAARFFFTANLYLTLPLIVILTVVFLHYWTLGDPIGLKAWLRGIGLPFTSGGGLTAIGPAIGATAAATVFYAISSVTVAHELVHWTSDRVAMATGRALFGFTLSPGFSIAHVYGHHRTVGTLKDHSTARRGESYLAFAWRCSIDEFAQAFEIEAARLTRKGFAAWSWRNRLLRACVYPLAIITVAWLLAGFAGVAAFLAAAILVKGMHRALDYTQHYGVVRVEGTPIQARHAWDSHRTVSNSLFYNLPRHSNHHMFAGRRAWELATADDSPRMPYGYNTMMFVALVPPLFHRLIDPRLAEWDRRLATDAERSLIRDRGWEIPGGAPVAPTAAAAP